MPVRNISESGYHAFEISGRQPQQMADGLVRLMERLAPQKRNWCGYARMIRGSVQKDGYAAGTMPVSYNGGRILRFVIARDAALVFRSKYPNKIDMSVVEETARLWESLSGE